MFSSYLPSTSNDMFPCSQPAVPNRLGLRFCHAVVTISVSPIGFSISSQLPSILLHLLGSHSEFSDKNNETP
jgi:hypothetical protein